MLLSHLTPYHVPNKIRFGVQQDGGYILSSDHMYVDKLISCGCDNQTSFEQDFLKYNPNSFVDIYDINNSCDLAKTTPAVKFYNERVVSLSQLDINTPCIIQMDIEGSELEIFNSYDGDFSNINQLIVELHFNYNRNYDLWARMLQKLNKYFYLIHLHGNNCVDFSHLRPIPDVLECTYINKRLCNDTLRTETQSYPIDNLDYPNCPGRPEISLSWWLHQ